MTLQTQVVRFQKSTGANGTTQDVNLNFTPKAIIVISYGGTLDANNTTAQYQQCVGFSDGTNHACFCIGSDDGSAAADTGRIHSNADVFIRVSEDNPANTVICRGSVAFATNKVTFTWTLNDVSATRITVWAFGGDDITNVKVNTVDINETVNGATEDYTGLGFTPSGNGNTALFLMGINHTANSNSAPTTTALSSFGCATSTTTSKQWCIAQCAENAADPSDTWRVSKTDGCYISLDTAGAAESNAQLSAWISDGFRLTWTDAPASTTVKMSYLVINGGDWDSGTLTTPTTATNDVDTAVSVNSHTIKGELFAGVGGTANGTITTYSIYSIGATDGTTQNVHSAIDEDAVPTMDSYRYTDATSVHYLQTDNGALTDRATFDSFGTNSFRLDYPTKSANAQLLHWVVVADQTTAAAAVEDISYQSYGNIHQEFDSNKNAIYG